MHSLRILISAAALAGCLASTLRADDKSIRADGDTLGADSNAVRAEGPVRKAVDTLYTPDGLPPPERRTTPHGEGKNHAFVIHPILSLAISGLHVSYEGPIGEGGWAYEVPVYLGYSEHVYDNPTLFVGSGFGIRRYLAYPGTGAFISPEIEIVNIHRFASGPDSTENVIVTVPSVSMGYKWRWEIMTMEFGVGFAFLDANVTNGNLETREDRFKGLIPMGHFAAGIPF